MCWLEKLLAVWSSAFVAIVVRKNTLVRQKDNRIGGNSFLCSMLRQISLALVVLLVAWGGGAEASVPLTIKCRFVRADTQADIGTNSDLLWVFVLDHSGSMDTRDATSVKTGRCVTRWEALKDGFEETAKSIPLGSKVQIYCVGKYGFWSSSDYAHRIYQEPKTISSDASRKKLAADVVSWGNPEGGTPLYDALYHACSDVKNFDGNACVVSGLLESLEVGVGRAVVEGCVRCGHQRELSRFVSSGLDGLEELGNRQCRKDKFSDGDFH